MVVDGEPEASYDTDDSRLGWNMTNGVYAGAATDSNKDVP